MPPVVDGVALWRARAPVLSIAGLTPRPKPRVLWHARDRAAWMRGLGVEGAAFAARGISAPWRREIERFVAEFRPDVLRVHDIITLPTAASVARDRGLLYVADLHESFPAHLDMLAASAPRGRRLALRMLWSSARWRARERLWLDGAAAVVVVVEEARARLERAGLAVAKITVVSNTEPQPAAPLPRRPADGRVVGLYLGSVGPERGVELCIDAMPLILRDTPRFVLRLIGCDASIWRRLGARATARGVAANVEVRGWIPPAEVPGAIAASDLGLVPHLASEHTDTTVPHKLFAFMAAGRPVVVSSCRPLRRIVEATGAGEVFAAGDAAALAAAIPRAVSHADEAAARGHAAAAGDYAWGHAAARLVRVYSEL